MKVFSRIVKLLDENQIKYVLSEHKSVRTSEEAAEVRGVDLKTGAKAMVLKSNNNFYLFILPGNRHLDWKEIRKILNEKSVRFATIEEAEDITNVKMGSVPPFGNILGIQTYFDPKLLENEFLNFNPGSTSHSISMKSKDLIEITSPNIVSFCR